MIEMERIQNLNLELGQEADGKVEDDQTDGRTDGRGFTSNINQNCEGASPLLSAPLAHWRSSSRRMQDVRAIYRHSVSS